MRRTIHPSEVDIQEMEALAALLDTAIWLVALEGKWLCRNDNIGVVEYFCFMSSWLGILKM